MMLVRLVKNWPIGHGTGRLANRKQSINREDWLGKIIEVEPDAPNNLWVCGTKEMYKITDERITMYLLEDAYICEHCIADLEMSIADSENEEQYEFSYIKEKIG